MAVNCGRFVIASAGAVYKNPTSPNLQSVTQAQEFKHSYKKNFPYIKKEKKSRILPKMKKKFADEIRSIEVDPISGEYYLTIPEWVMNEASWYEYTRVKFIMESGEIILREQDAE